MLPTRFYRFAENNIVRKMWKLNQLTALCTILLLSAASTPTQANSTTYQVTPALVVLGDTGNAIGVQFTVNVTVADAADMYGLDVTLSWNTTYLAYVDHTPTIPVETYPGGVLHAPTFFTKNEVNEAAGTYWLAAATLGEAPFTGNGTVVEITFRIIDQPTASEVPPPPNNYVSLPLQLYAAETPCYDGEVRIYSPPPDYPPFPSVKVLPELIGDKQVNETFLLDVWLMGEHGLDLEPIFDVSGVDLHLHFDPELLEVISVAVDPDGWFASFWPTGITERAKEIDNTAGTVHAAFNASDEMHVPVHGRGRIVSVEVNALAESSTWPPPSCTLGLKNPPPHPVICGYETQIYVEGYQHPENEYPPWNGSETRVPLPHTVENATYFMRYAPGISAAILTPTAKNYSQETVWLNVTANVPINTWRYSINHGGNVSFTPNTRIDVVQGDNILTIYASTYGMTGTASIQFYALAGDVDEDRDVDIFDIVDMAGIYGVAHPDPRYKANCDVDSDGDIDLFDLVTAAGNYGKG